MKKINIVLVTLALAIFATACGRNLAGTYTGSASGTLNSQTINGTAQATVTQGSNETVSFQISVNGSTGTGSGTISGNGISVTSLSFPSGIIAGSTATPGVTTGATGTGICMGANFTGMLNIADRSFGGSVNAAAAAVGTTPTTTTPGYPTTTPGVGTAGTCTGSLNLTLTKTQ